MWLIFLGSRGEGIVWVDLIFLESSVVVYMLWSIFIILVLIFLLLGFWFKEIFRYVNKMFYV